MQILSLDWEDPLEEKRATHSNTLAWESPWVEEPGGLQSVGSQRVAHDLACTHICISQYPEQAPWRQKGKLFFCLQRTHHHAAPQALVPQSIFLLPFTFSCWTDMQYLSFNPTLVCLLDAQQSHLWTPGCGEGKYSIYCQAPSKEKGQLVFKKPKLDSGL